MLSRIPLRVFDVLWLVALGLYVLAGVPIATFHGDETNFIYDSHDYTTAFIQGRPLDLVIDFRQPEADYYLRLADSSVSRYTIGFFWQMAGFHDSDLPMRGWDWGQPYDTNVAEGLRPPPALLDAARLPSALFLCLSVVLVFVIGNAFGERPVAYLASMFYAFNPIILLSARRATQEGSLLFFGLLTIALAVVISRRISEKEHVGFKWWTALTLAGGLTLASKNSGFLYIVSALGWIFAAGLSKSPKQVALLMLKLAASGLLMLGLLVAFSPGLWGDPISGLEGVWRVRIEQMDEQEQAVIPMTTIGERAQAILTEPFMQPVQQFEIAGWEWIPQIGQEAQTYMASPLSGIQFGTVGGGLVMALASIGILTLIVPRWSATPRYLAWGVLIWLGVNIAVLLVNPLPWQRYYIALIPILSLLAGVGILHVVMFIFGFIADRRQREI